MVVAEHLPEISDKVLEELNEQVTQLIYTMNYSLDNAFANFDRQRDELQRYVTAERQALVDQLRESADGVVQRTLDAVPGLVGKVLLYVVLALVVLVGGPFALGFWLGGVARAGTQEEGKERVTACFPRWIAYLCGKRISAQAGGARAYCRQSLHLRSACTIFAAKSGLWHEKKQITP